jgi:hypothetical protein
MSTMFYLVNHKENMMYNAECKKINEFVEEVEKLAETKGIKNDYIYMMTLKDNLLLEVDMPEEIELAYRIGRTGKGNGNVEYNVWLTQEYVEDSTRNGHYVIMDEYDNVFTTDEFFRMVQESEV